VTRSGYTFAGWDRTFSNVTADITVTAQWTSTGGNSGSGSRNNNNRSSGESVFRVTFNTAGGTRTGGGELVQTVALGGAAVAPIVTRDGYTFDDWDRSFSNVRSNITVTAQWISDEVIDDNPVPLGGIHYFDDVTETLFSWALEACDTLAEAGVIKGTSYRIYSPADAIKRGDFTLMLARAYDIKDAFTENFPDVPIDSYYYDAIAVARALGIAQGDGTNYHPETFITRQDMMVLFDRTLQTIERPLPAGEVAALSSFADNNSIAGYARASVATLVQANVIRGDGSGINPLGNTTRAEMAVVVYRVLAMK
jgi:hypothetical protein